MRRQLVGQVVSVEPDVHQVHGQRELVGVQHAVLVDVRQFPDLAQNVVRKLRLDHLLLGGCKERQKNSLLIIDIKKGVFILILQRTQTSLTLKSTFNFLKICQ